jgi:glycosyltransferase involved in cell wall biosynthesis
MPAARSVPPAKDPPRFLLIAFAYAPGEGSEPGAGWSFARVAAGIGETWVLYRSEGPGDARLLAAARALPEGDRLHLVPVTQAYMAGHPPTRADWRGERLEYLLWQLRALRVARRIARREHIDLVWHVSWSTVWLGSIGGLVGPRFIWGPVGGGVGPPWPVLASLGRRGAAVELVRWLVRPLCRLNPLVLLAWARADLILAQNADTVRWLPGAVRSRVEIFHRIALDDQDVPTRGRRERADRPLTALFAGRLLAWKGAWLAIDAIARLEGWRLVICGEGPEEQHLRDRAREAGVTDRVAFLGQVERPELLRMMREDADVFLFPSLHEEGGWVVGEAIASGLPVVCIDRGGPPTIGGTGVTLGTAEQTAERLARAVQAAVDSHDPLPSAPMFQRRRTALVGLLRAHGLVDPAAADDDPATRPAAGGVT